FHIQCLAPERHGRPRASARFIPLQRAAADIWGSLEERIGTRFEYLRSGGAVVAETDAEVEILRAKHILEAQGGIESYLLDAAAVRSELPILSPSVIAADICPEDGYVNPLKVVPALLAAAEREGARMRAASPVTAIDTLTHGYRVRSGDQAWTTS